MKGTEAVDWLSENLKITRDEATELGRMLMYRGLIQHVTNTEPFADKPVLFQFVGQQVRVTNFNFI